VERKRIEKTNDHSFIVFVFRMNDKVRKCF
jgi:hypothetical protein